MTLLQCLLQIILDKSRHKYGSQLSRCPSRVQVFDYIVNAVKRTAPSIAITDDDDMATREDFSSWEWLVLNVCEVRHSLLTSMPYSCSRCALAIIAGVPTKVLPARQSHVLPTIMPQPLPCCQHAGQVTYGLILYTDKDLQAHPEVSREACPALCRLQASWHSSWRGCTSLTQS